MSGSATTTAPVAGMQHNFSNRVTWLKQALALVQNETSTDAPLLKEKLWELSSSKDGYSFPSKSILSDSLSWLRKQRYIHTIKSDGTKKHPRFGFCPREKGTHTITEATPEAWAVKCQKEKEGHKRAMMVSDQAVNLSKIVVDRQSLIEDISESSAKSWKIEDTRSPKEVEPGKFTSKDAQKKDFLRRLKKAVDHEMFLLRRTKIDTSIAQMSAKFLKEMDAVASQGLSAGQQQDYAAQVKKQVSCFQLRESKKKVASEKHARLMTRYASWMECLDKGTLADLEVMLKTENLSLRTMLSDSSVYSPEYLVSMEAIEAKHKAENLAQESLAAAEFRATKAEQKALRLQKKAKSTQDIAYAERVLKDARTESEWEISSAQAQIKDMQSKPDYKFDKEAKRMAKAQAWAWFQESKAAGEVKVIARQQPEQTLQDNGHGTDDMLELFRNTMPENRRYRVVGSASKRAAGESYVNVKREMDNAEKRWSRRGSMHYKSAKPQTWLGSVHVSRGKK